MQSNSTLRLLGAISVSTTLSACYRDVDMDLVNPLNFDQNVTIQEYADQAPIGSPIYAGTVPANKDKDYLLTNIRIGHVLDISGSTKGEQKLSVVKGDGAQKATVGLPAGTSLLTDAQSAAQLVNAFLVVGSTNWISAR